MFILQTIFNSDVRLKHPNVNSQNVEKTSLCGQMCFSSRMTFMGLITGLYMLSNMLWGNLYLKIVKRQKKLALKNQAKENGLEGESRANGHASINIDTNKDDTDKESTI